MRTDRILMYHYQEGEEGLRANLGDREEEKERKIDRGRKERVSREERG